MNINFGKKKSSIRFEKKIYGQMKWERSKKKKKENRYSFGNKV